MGTIKEKISARKKLFEMTRKLNGSSINESLKLSDEVYSAFMVALESLGRGNLLRKFGGNSNVKTQKTEDDNYFVEIVGNDKEKNEYYFLFEIELIDSLEDDVIQVQDVIVKEFTFKDENKEISLGENDLREFNKSASNVYLFDYIDIYIDFDFESDIEKIKK